MVDLFLASIEGEQQASAIFFWQLQSMKLQIRTMKDCGIKFFISNEIE